MALGSWAVAQMMEVVAMLQILRKNGTPTAYGFACGYHAQRHPEGTHLVTVTIWKEHGVFHVRAHDFTDQRRLCWNTFRLVNEAYRHFYSVKGCNPCDSPSVL